MQGRSSGCSRRARLLPFLQREGGTSDKPGTRASLSSLRKTGSEARGKPDCGQTLAAFSGALSPFGQWGHPGLLP